MRRDAEEPEGIDPLDSETAALLGASLRPVEPPPALKEALMARVHESARAPAYGSGSPQSPTEDRTVVTIHERRPMPRVMRIIGQAAAAVALLGVGMGVGHWTAMHSMDATSHFAALNQAQDVDRVTDTMPDGHVATLTWSKGMDMAAVTLPTGLRASEGRSLQVWVRNGDTVTKAGMYEPAKGTAFSFLDIMPEPGIEILITEEPEGGSDQPTGDPLVVLRIGEGAKTA